MKKTLTMILAFALVFALGVGGTLAWLTDKTEEVTNVFTSSDINVTLTEANPTVKNDIKMVPGLEIAKNPKAKVEAGSEPCWLFVKVEYNAEANEFLTWSVDTAWGTAIETGEGYAVYAKKIDTAEKMNVEYSILTGDKVTVKTGITKADMTENFTEPELTFTAYASQLMNNTTEFTAAQAWANID